MKSGHIQYSLMKSAAGAQAMGASRCVDGSISRLLFLLSLIASLRTVLYALRSKKFRKVLYPVLVKCLIILLILGVSIAGVIFPMGFIMSFVAVLSELVAVPH
jgi:hypothetical protein